MKTLLNKINVRSHTWQPVEARGEGKRHSHGVGAVTWYKSSRGKKATVSKAERKNSALFIQVSPM